MACTGRKRGVHRARVRCAQGVSAACTGSERGVHRARARLGRRRNSPGVGAVTWWAGRRREGDGARRVEGWQ